MKLILTLLLSILSLQIFGQNEQEFKEAAQKRNNAKSWNDLANYYSEHKDSVNLRKAFTTAYQLAIKERNTEEQGRALIYRATHELLCNGKYTDSYLQTLKRASALLSKTPFNKDLGSCYHQISQVYNTTGDYEKALQYLFKAEPNCKSTDPTNIGTVYCDIGYAYLYKGMPDSARHYTQKAKLYAAIYKDTLSLTVSYTLLGIMSRRENKFSEALTYYLKGAELYEKQCEWRRLVIEWCNIAVLYTDWEKYPKALEFGNKAVKASHKYHLSQKDRCRALLILGPPLIELNQVREAIETYKKALPFLEKSHDKYSCLFGLVKGYDKLNMSDSTHYYMQKLEGEFAQAKATYTDTYYNFKGLMAMQEQQYATAIEYYEKALNLRNKKKRAIERNSINTYLNLSTAYEKGVHNYKKALLYKDMALSLQDSMYQLKHSELMSEYYAKFETAEKELEINRLQIKQQELRYNAILLFGGFCGIVVFLSIALLYNHVRRLKKEKEATLLLQRIGQKETEFLTLQQETEQRLTRKYIDGLESERERLAIELHDNVCNNILGLEMKIGTLSHEIGSEAQQQMKKLAEIRNKVRNISHELMPPIFQYATIDEMLNDFVTHHKSFSHTQITYQSTPNVDWSTLLAQLSFELYRITQESVHNALKYAAAKNIVIALQLEKQLLSLEVRDDGKGFDVNKKTTGIGLQTISKRVESINGSLTIASQIDVGTTITAKISLT